MANMRPEHNEDVSGLHAMISAIINLICPQCGGGMMEYRCRGKCRKEWRSQWQRAIAMTREGAIPRQRVNQRRHSKTLTP